MNTDSQKKLDFGVSIDDRDYFSLQSEIGITAEKNADMYRTSLEVRIPEKRLVAVTGSAELRHRQKYIAQLQIEDLTAKPILMKGVYINPLFDIGIKKSNNIILFELSQLKIYFKTWLGEFRKLKIKII